MRRLRILTWNVDSAYLRYLAQVDHEFYLPTRSGRPVGYAGLAGRSDWSGNVNEVPAEAVPSLTLDCVLYQAAQQYQSDRFQLLSAQQQRLPAIFLEHQPPQAHPTDTQHVVDDPQMLLVHVTDFNELMWNNGRTPTIVIPHGVSVPADVHYSGQLSRGLCMLDNPAQHSRSQGADVFQQAAGQVFLDLVGRGSEALAGSGEVPPEQWPAHAARYRFLFSPVRYGTPSLAVCEAMMVGLPVVGLATTQLAAEIVNGVSGYLDTDVDRLVTRMQELIDDAQLAQQLSYGVRRRALERFSLGRFVRQWNEALHLVTDRREMWQSAAVTRAGGDEQDLNIHLPEPVDAERAETGARV